MSGSAIDLGTIYSTIRIALEPLQQDAHQAVGILDELQARVKELSAQVSSIVTESLQSVGQSVDAPVRAALGQVDEAAQQTRVALDQVGAAGATAGAEAAAGGEEAAAGLREAGLAAKEGGSGVKGFLGNVLGIGGAIGGVMLATQAFGFLRDKVSEAVQAGMQANQVAAQTVAGLKSTHDASGQTTESIDALSTRIMQMTGIDDDAVHSAANMLLTFTNIGKGVFPQATQAVADLATKMANGAVPSAMQMQQASIQLGKALGDPTKGYTALQRVGVTFTAQQVEQIKQMQKAGNIAGAQKVILAEMNKEFGGSAQAAGRANGGIAILRAEMENTTQTIGQALIPVVNQLTGALAPLLQWAGTIIPEALKSLQQHVDDVKILLASFLAVAIGPLTVALWGLLVPLGTVVAGAVATAAPFILLGAAIAGVALYMRHLYETSAPFRNAVDNLKSVLTELAAIIQFHLQQGLQSLMPYVQQLARWLGGELAQAAQAINPLIIKTTETLTQLGRNLFTQVGPAIDGVFGFLRNGAAFIAANFLPTVARISATAQTVAGVLSGAFSSGFHTASNVIQLVWSFLQPLWQTLSAQLHPILQTLATTLTTNLAPAWKSIQGAMGNVLPIVQNLAKIIGGALTPVWNVLKPILIAIGAVIAGTLLTAIGLLIGLLNGLFAALGQVIQGAIKFAGGLIQAIGGALQVVTSIISGVLAIIVDLFTGNWSKIGSDAVKAWNGIKDGVSNIVQGLWMAIQGIFQAGIGGVKALISGLISGVIGYFTTLWDKLTGHSIIPDMVNDIVSWFKQLPGKALAAVQNLTSNLADFFTTLASNATTWGENFVKMFAQGITNDVNLVKNAVTNVMNGAKAILGFHSPAEEGPGADADTWAPNLMAMFAHGILASAPDLQNAAVAALLGVRAALTSGLTGATVTTGSISGTLAASAAPVNVVQGGVLREAITSISSAPLASGSASLLAAASGPTAGASLAQLAQLGGGVNIEHLEVTVATSPSDGEPYQAGVAFGNGFAAGFQQARAQRGL